MPIFAVAKTLGAHFWALFVCRLVKKTHTQSTGVQAIMSINNLFNLSLKLNLRIQ
jgi:predicted permease